MAELQAEVEVIQRHSRLCVPMRDRVQDGYMLLVEGRMHSVWHATWLTDIVVRFAFRTYLLHVYINKQRTLLACGYRPSSHNLLCMNFKLLAKYIALPLSLLGQWMRTVFRCPLHVLWVALYFRG